MQGKGPLTVGGVRLPALKPSVHHSLAWLHKVYQLENWSTGQLQSRHYFAELLRQAAAHLEDPVWDPTDDFRAIKQLFIWLLVYEVRLSAL